MNPLVLYTAAQQPNLLATFDTFRQMLGEYIGYTSDESAWTSTEVSELDRRVQEIYRWILYPATIPGEKLSHVWDCMKQDATLTTVANQQAYTLPSDTSMIDGDFTYPSGTWCAPIRKTSPADIRKKAMLSSSTSYPVFYATRWKAQVAGLNQRQEVLFWPTPSAVWNLNYVKVVLPGPLSKSNPYPLGGPQMSQLMIEGIKAIGEAVKMGRRGDQWALFIDRLEAAIRMDRTTSQDVTVGPMVDPTYTTRSWQNDRVINFV